MPNPYDWYDGPGPDLDPTTTVIPEYDAGPEIDPPAPVPGTPPPTAATPPTRGTPAPVTPPPATDEPTIVSGLAHRGKPAPLPPRATVAIHEHQRLSQWAADNAPVTVDMNDLTHVQQATDTLNRKLREIEDILTVLEGVESETQIAYRIVRDEAMILTSGGSEKTREAYAELIAAPQRIAWEQSRRAAKHAERLLRLFERNLSTVEGQAHTARTILRHLNP